MPGESAPVASRRSDAAVYDRKTVILHWATAVLVIALWCLGQTIDWFPRGTARIAARSVHILCGVILTAVIAWRLWWRGTGGVRLPPAGSRLWHLAAKFVHYALYLLLIATVVLGIANAWIRGDSIFGVLRIPAFDPGNHALKTRVEDLHSWSANLLFTVAALHAVVALVHHFVIGDGVLRRMLRSRAAG